MGKFICKANVEHDGKAYSPGEVVDLTEAQAASMPHAVEVAPLASDPKKSEPAQKSTK